VEERKLEEIEFHNRRERDRRDAADEEEFIKKYPNKAFYSINRGPRDATRKWLESHCQGSVALDYCCGLGKTTLELASLGATVHAIDISGEELVTAQQAAADAGYTDRTHFYEMDAESMEFPDDMFDVIVCSGVLHHLDLKSAYPELARVLKPTGKIIAIEAQGANPIINLYRRKTPHLRTSWEADHILSFAQVKQAKAYFSAVNITYFHLFTILGIPFRRTPFFSALLSVLETLDKFVLRLPGVQRMAWQMMFVLSDPKPGTAGRRE
jgi:ubiquinone/menaquinone biosynthesis C-methylase UbiE